jgi:hypothetical protein
VCNACVYILPCPSVCLSHPRPTELPPLHHVARGAGANGTCVKSTWPSPCNPIQPTPRRHIHVTLPQMDSGDDGVVHPEFRLWLTSAPCTSFPVSIARRSTKLCTAPPSAFRDSVTRAMSIASACDIPRTLQSYPVVWRRFLLSLCTLHAVLLERRKYMPLGWGRPYHFSNEDLRIAAGEVGVCESMKRVLTCFHCSLRFT